MEVEEPISDLGNTSVVQDPVLPEKDTIEDEPVNLEKTIEVENSSLKSNPTESTDGNSTQENTLDNGKKKVKEEKPPTKIVVRRLPPTMTKDQFLEQVSPLPEIDYMYYVHGDVYNNINPYSRAYLNFVNQEDLFSFSRTFDNYVFLDSKGQEYPAIVEFAMFQRVPKQRTKKKDPLMGTIESDPSFIAFKENLLAEALENSKAGGKAIKQHYFETEISTAEEVNTTPLLEYLKVRRAEKARIREERKEEKKRKEIERKLKQKTKDKKGEGDEEESPKDMKIQHKQSEKHEMETLSDKTKQVSDKEKVGKSDNPKENEQSNEKKSDTVIKIPFHSDKKITVLMSNKENFEFSTHNGKQKKMDSQSDCVKSPLHISDTKCDRLLSSNPKMGQLVQKVEEIKIKEAEQQTIYLRKLLGLVPTEGELSSNDNEVSGKSNDKSKTSSNSTDASLNLKNVSITEQLSKVEPPEEVLSAFKEYINVTKKKEILWSKHNINPALPSASFKTSNSSPSQPNMVDSSFEQRSLSAPRESSETLDTCDGGLGRQVASSTPNVSLSQSLKLLTEVSDSAGEEVLSSKERRDIKEKENRTIKKKDDKEKPKETRAREFKSRGGKSYQEERLKLAERREEQKKKDMLNSDKRLEVSETNDVSESTDPVTEQSKTEEKSVKVEKRKYDNRRGGKYDDEWKDEKKRNRNDKNNSKRDGRDRKDEYSRRSDRKNSDLDLRRKGKTTRNQDSKYEKRKFTAAQDEEQESKVSPEPLERKEESDIPLKKIRSCDDLRFASVSEATVSTVLSNSDDSSKERKRCSSLENPRSLENQSSLSEVEKLISEKRGKSQKEMKQSEGSCSYRSRKDLSNKKNSSDSKSVSSKKKDRSDDTTEDDPGHKNRGHDDKPEGDIKETGKSKDSSRPDRRIRNKDRPSIEIYRPGMGKFSKQRLEKEKALGSSTEIESPSHSPSPTPKSKLIS